MKARKYLIVFMAATAIAAGVVILANWRIDPLQVYRKASYPPFLSEQARFRNPGLARHYDHDIAIVGTSVSLGYDLEAVGRTLGGRAINLAMQGASAHEQSLIVSIALQSGRPRRVIWDLNYEFFRGSPDWVSDFDGSFPGYLYDSNRWNELPNYLLNLDTTKDSIRVWLGRYPRRSLQELTGFRGKRKYGRESVRAAFQRARAGRFVFKARPEEFAPGKLRASFEANCVTHLQRNPNVAFDLYFPPFSFAYHALIRAVAPRSFEDSLRWKEFVLERTRTLPNVRVHDFQGIPEIVLDLDRYVDTVHFDAATHEYVIDAIATAKHLATPESVGATAAFLEREALPGWTERRP